MTVKCYELPESVTALLVVEPKGRHKTLCMNREYEVNSEIQAWAESHTVQGAYLLLVDELAGDLQIRKHPVLTQGTN